MELWEWLLVALAVTAVAGILGFAALKMTRRGRALLALSPREKLRFLSLLVRQGGIGWPARILLVVLIGYLAMPIDLVPDFLPIIGHADDALVLFAVVAIVVLLVPGDRFQAALAEAQRPMTVQAELPERAGPSRDAGLDGMAH